MTGYRGAAIGTTLKYRTTSPVRIEAEAGSRSCQSGKALTLYLLHMGKAGGGGPRESPGRSGLGAKGTTNPN